MINGGDEEPLTPVQSKTTCENFIQALMLRGCKQA